MRRVIGSRVQGIVIFLLFLLYTITCPLSTSLAAEASPSSSLQAKLNLLKQEIASKAAKLKSAISSEIQNKAYVGFIQTLSDGQYTLVNLDGSPRVVSINDFTKTDFIGKKISQKISKGDFIIALGDVDDKSRLVAKKVIKEASPSATPTSYLWGKITSKDSTSIDVLTKDNKAVTVNLTSDTSFKLKNDDATIADAKEGNFLVGVGTLTKDGNLDARFVYLIPYPGYIKEASQSARLDATTESQRATPSGKKK